MGGVAGAALHHIAAPANPLVEHHKGTLKLLSSNSPSSPLPGPHLPHVAKEALEQPQLVHLIEHHKGTLELGLGGVLKVTDVLPNHLSVHDQVALKGNGEAGDRSDSKYLQS